MKSEENGRDQSNRAVRSRREVLANIVKGGALASSAVMLDMSHGVVAAGAGLPRSEALANSSTSANQPSPYAADGLLTMFVEGDLVSVQGSSVILSVAKPGVGAAKILVPSTTPVFVRGMQLTGDLSQCQPGDDVAVATTMTSSGQRIATWLYSNFVACDGIINGMSDTELSISPAPKYANKFGPDVMSEECAVHVLTNTDVHAETYSVTGSTAPFQVGQTVYVTGTAPESPIYRSWPSELWGLHLFQLVTVSSTYTA